VTGLPRPCLCLITDRRRVAPRARTRADEIAALERWLDEACDARVDLIQIRERDLGAKVLVALTTRVVRRAAGRPVRILVNDRVDVARAADAAGVHLRGDGAPAPRVRETVPSSWIIGRSVHSIAEVERSASTDYLVFGTVFSTVSKVGSPSLAGVDGLRAAVSASRVPVLAIGGMTPATAPLVAGAGAAGLAAIGVFLPEGVEPGALGVMRAGEALRAAWP
jgi:thiamine-phosphate diphosphorylase